MWQRLGHHTRKFSSKTTVHVPPPSIGFRLTVYSVGLSASAGILYASGIGNSLWGCIAGATAKTATAPLERVTTVLQVGMEKQTSGIRLIKEVITTEGTMGLWKGNSMNAWRAFVQKGSLYGMNDFYRGSFEPFIENQIVSGFLSGLCAGCTSTMFTYPLEVAKTNMQAHVTKEGRSSMAIWWRLYSHQGLSGMWVGLFPTLLGTSAYYAIKFGTFDIFHEKIQQNSLIHVSEPFLDVTSGMFAGILGNLICFPNNPVRKELQTRRALGESTSYWQIAQSIFSKKGPTGFYRGMGWGLIKTAPNTGLQFGIYKGLQRWFNPVPVDPYLQGI